MVDIKLTMADDSVREFTALNYGISDGLIVIRSSELEMVMIHMDDVKEAKFVYPEEVLEEGDEPSEDNVVQLNEDKEQEDVDA